MRENILKVLLLTALLAAFAIAVTPVIAQEPAGEEDTSADWCCRPPHPTYPTKTPTPTPTPELKACQITSIIFGQESYLTGDTIEVTARVADSEGTPLVGGLANAEVSIGPLQVQAPTGFGLVDRAGDYDGVYEDANLPGAYTFEITVSDPTGERFLPCTASETVDVLAPTPTPTPTDTPSPTPTDTPSPTPTNTPTPTPTPAPAVVTVPDQLETNLCSLLDTSIVRLENISNLAQVEIEITYDPLIIQVIDSDPDQAGVQVGVSSVFEPDTVTENDVDTFLGTIRVIAGTAGVPVLTGSADLLSINWRPQRVGTSTVAIESLTLTDATGQTSSPPVQDGTVDVQFVTNCLNGVVNLEGSAEHGGVLVTNAAGDRTVSLPDGRYRISASDSLSFEKAGYVSAEADVSQAVAAAAEGQTITVAEVTLPAGDVTGDNVVNILDMAYLASKYGTADPLADLTGDGRVDILDLALCAANFWQTGPVISSQ
jgi:hypothetical protein